MYAILTGTDRNTQRHLEVLNRLISIADQSGFTPPDCELRISPDQQSLSQWMLTLRGPQGEPADFFLAVTAPSIPGVSPIPVQKTVKGPMFAVTVMDSFFGIRREDQKDYIECKDENTVDDEFRDFIKSQEVVKCTR
ncbi:MAG: hypothetical protein PF495_20610 [Spirochaetales bacterium]|jgi:hypothetical protein|nr:hypothetical protein [Spirochaetales bacterium]